MKPADHRRIHDGVRTLCLDLPETSEVEAWGHATFRAPKKMFAIIGDDTADGTALGLKMTFDRQEELLKDPRFAPMPYGAHQGWVTLRLDADTDWDEVAALIREAYRQVALKRMLKALDEM